MTLFYSLTAFTTPRLVPSNIFTSQLRGLRGGKYFLWWREWNIFILDEIVYGVGLCRDLLELNIQTEQIITPRRHRRPDLSRTLFSSSKNNKSGARAQPGTHQLRLFKYETGFHSDSSGNIISEIIVKADFDPTFIIRRKEEDKITTFTCMIYSQSNKYIYMYNSIILFQKYYYIYII